MFRKIAKNTLFLSISQIAASLIGFFYFIFLARSLGVQNFGYYTFTLAYVYTFIPLADFGMERLVLREISREPSKIVDYYSKIFPLRITLALFAYFFIAVTALLLKQPLNQLFYVILFGLGIIPYSLIFLFSSFQNAKEKMEYMSLANILTTLFTAIIGTFLVMQKVNLIWVFSAYPIANTIVLLFFVLFSKKQGFSFNFKIDFGFWKEVLKESWFFAFLTILAVFYLRLSVLMTNLFLGPVATGYYGSVFKLVESLILLPQSLALALFPLSSRLINENKVRLKSLYLKTLGILFFISIPVVLVFVFFPKIIIDLSFGPQYLPALPLFGILSFAVVLFFLNSLPGNVIQNSKQFKKFLPFAVANFIIALILCLLLIPRFGIVGSAWAVVGGELAGFILNNYFVWRVFKKEI